MIEDFYYDIRNNFCNKIIIFLIKHCAIYSNTLYAIGKKCSPDELQIIVDELKKER